MRQSFGLINRTGRFSSKVRDSSKEARAHRSSKNRVETCEVQASLTLPSNRTAADGRHPTSQISAGQESGPIAARADGGRSTKTSTDATGREYCNSGAVKILVIGAGSLECNEEGISKV